MRVGIRRFDARELAPWRVSQVLTRLGIPKKVDQIARRAAGAAAQQPSGGGGDETAGRLIFAIPFPESASGHAGALMIESRVGSGLPSHPKLQRPHSADASETVRQTAGPRGWRCHDEGDREQHLYRLRQGYPAWRSTLRAVIRNNAIRTKDSAAETIHRECGEIYIREPVTVRDAP